MNLTGCAINWDGKFGEAVKGDTFFQVIDFILNSVCFIYIGAWLPLASFNTPTLGIVPWRLVVLFVCVLTLRRIPAVLLLFKWIPEIHTWGDALFCGHYGEAKFGMPPKGNNKTLNRTHGSGCGLYLKPSSAQAAEPSSTTAW
jgi:sodium/hydrogen antiporter